MRAPLSCVQRGHARRPDLGCRGHQGRPAGAQPERQIGLGQAAGGVVARDHAGAAARGADERLDEVRGGWVEIGAGLAEQQLGLVQHRAGHGQPLDHPRE